MIDFRRDKDGVLKAYKDDVCVGEITTMGDMCSHMTEKEFRVKHSELIMYYQFIEMKLKGLCAGLTSDSLLDWFVNLPEYKTDPMGKLIEKVKELQKNQSIPLLSDEEFKELDELRQARNYWCHQCFGGDCPVVFKKDKTTGEYYMKCSDHSVDIERDLNVAMDWEVKLANLNREVSNY